MQKITFTLKSVVLKTTQSVLNMNKSLCLVKDNNLTQHLAFPFIYLTHNQQKTNVLLWHKMC